MAEKNTLHLISELERRYLECNVCSEIFNEDNRVPRLLPCHHTFCTTCLKKIIKNDCVKCPTCNAKHKLKNISISNFPKDNIRRDLTSFLETQTKGSICDDCKSTTNTSYKCTRCLICICEMCKTDHEKQNPKHIFELKTSIFQKNDEKLDLCQKPAHHKSQVKYFCNSPFCQCTVCPMCVVEDHRDKTEHELENVHEAFESRKSNLKRDVAQLRERILQVKHSKSEASERIRDLTDKKKNFTEKIELLFKKGMNNLQDHRDILMLKYNSKFDESENKLRGEEEELGNFISNSEECCDLSEQLFNTDSASSFLNVHQVLERHVRQFLETHIKEFEAVVHDDITVDLEAFRGMVKRSKTMIQENVQTPEPQGQNGTKEQTQKEKVGMFKLIRNQLFRKQHNTVPVDIYNDHRHCPGITYGNGDERFDHLAVNDLQAKIWGYLTSIFRNLLFISSLIFVLALPVRYLVPDRFFERAQFTSKENSSFSCRNALNTTYSTFPDIGLLCGSPSLPFKFKGGFLNSTLFPPNKNGFDFLVRFKRNFDHPSVDNTKAVFEFGLLTRNVVFVHFLKPKIVFSFTAYICATKPGVCMISGDGTNIDTTKLFYSSKMIPGFMEGIFHFGFRPQSSELRLINLRRNEVVYTFTDFYTLKALRPVFGAYESEQFSTTFTIPETEPFEFHRKSLHPSLYISTDNKIISNRKTSMTNKHDTFYPYIFTKRNTFRTRNIRLVLLVEYEVSKDDTSRDTFLEIGFGVYKNNSFLPFRSFNLIYCSISSYYIFRWHGYCLRDRGNPGTLFVADSPLRLYIHYHPDGIFDFYILGHFLSYVRLKLKIDVDKNFPSRFYVKRQFGTEVKIQTDDTGNLFNVGFPLFVDYLLGFNYTYVRS